MMLQSRFLDINKRKTFHSVPVPRNCNRRLSSSTADRVSVETHQHAAYGTAASDRKKEVGRPAPAHRSFEAEEGNSDTQVLHRESFGPNTAPESSSGLETTLPTGSSSDSPLSSFALPSINPCESNKNPPKSPRFANQIDRKPT